MELKIPRVLIVLLVAPIVWSFQKSSSVPNSFNNWGEWSQAELAAPKVDINEFLIGVIENFREDMKTGIPELKVPVLDPFKYKKSADVDVEDSKASIHGNFTNILVEGLSGFELVNLQVDLHELSLNFSLRIPHVLGTGNYSIEGKVIKIIPVRGHGEFRVESYNLSVAAQASLVTAYDDHLQLADDFDVHIDFDKVELYLENFMGGGRWADTLLKILNDISKDLFQKFLPLLKGELNKSLLKVINKHLIKLPITSIVPSTSADEYVDQILTNVQKIIKEKKLDPMTLPDYFGVFSKEVMYINFTGEAKMYNGTLWGISTIHRTDECLLETNKTTISVSAHLGLADLRLSYLGHAKFMSMGPSLQCGGRIDKVAFYFHIEQSNRKGATPVLRDFDIVELSTIWVELSGLGPLTWVLKWLMTGITKLLNNYVEQKVTLTVKEYMAAEFEKLSFPV